MCCLRLQIIGDQKLHKRSTQITYIARQATQKKSSAKKMQTVRNHEQKLFLVKSVLMKSLKTNYISYLMPTTKH